MAKSIPQPGTPIARRTFLHRTRLLALGIAVMPLIQACGRGSAEGDGGTGATADARNVTVEMNDELKFVPDKLTVKVGDAVTWRNVGTIPHTATDDPGKAFDPVHAKLPPGAQPWDSGIVEGGKSWSYAFAMPGEYTYFCIPHEAAGMVASITVTE